MIRNIENAINDIRLSKPVVLNLTNYVTMDFIANCLLALGAAPIMSVCDEELEELVAISSAININIGTLNDHFINQCIKASEFANKYRKPIVLDPVGAGATKIRTSVAKNLMRNASIVRGNASEVIALAHDECNTKGVESVHTTNTAKVPAIDLANIYQCILVVSGSIDFITDGSRQIEVPYGSVMMPLVTGMGCALTSILAAFASVIKDPFEASNIGIHYFTLCGELAARSANHPASFRMAFIDNIHSSDFDNMRKVYAR